MNIWDAPSSVTEQPNQNVKGMTYIDHNRRPHRARPWPFKRFKSSEVQDNSHRPEGQDVEDTNEPEEELHVDPRFSLDSDFEKGNVESVENG